MGEMRTLAAEGDLKVMWDPKNEDEVEAANEQFDALIDKGYAAYSVKKDGEQGKKITKFSPSAGKIIMVPPIGGG